MKYHLTSRDIFPEIRFEASRSSGPGGQNVNKVNSRITLIWNVATSGCSPEVKDRLLHKWKSRLINGEEIKISAQEHRSQLQNKEEACGKLDALLLKALFIPKKRKPTKPTKQSKKKRLESKKKDSQKKQNRKTSWESEK